MERVAQAIQNHRGGKDEDLSITVLEMVAGELRRMEETRDKFAFQPTYGRAILDWPDNHGLVEYLLGVAHDYNRWT